jgi:hypothetical protein
MRMMTDQRLIEEQMVRFGMRDSAEGDKEELGLAAHCKGSYLQ